MALSGTPTNRTSIDLPVEISQEILAKTQEQSAVKDSLVRLLSLAEEPQSMLSHLIPPLLG